MNFDHVFNYLTGGAINTTVGLLVCILVPLVLGAICAKLIQNPPNWREGGARGKLLSQYAGLCYLMIAVIGEPDFSLLEKVGLYGIFVPTWILSCHVIFEIAIAMQEKISSASSIKPVDLKEIAINSVTNFWLILVEPIFSLVSWFSNGYAKSNK